MYVPVPVTIAVAVPLLPAQVDGVKLVANVNDEAEEHVDANDSFATKPLPLAITTPPKPIDTSYVPAPTASEVTKASVESYCETPVLVPTKILSHPSTAIPPN